ncbi:hypothetical protein RI138_20435 [Streptomyces sp. C11-1]|uniref:Integral membrane protein n=1 Tax=Streptomyces durocortorensis TaxID=2811104 RepID=A0ABY9W1Q8_9ACTN|nr:hypothetical protein [Streptomyces durocortorensis]WNF29001.1 hypothetical protein RI138_20435 [Streptomyces durocortorensis]
MSRRAPLPPPPPPVEIRSWPGREAMLADRAVVLGELVKMHVGPGRLGLLWMWAGLAALGWSFLGTGILMFQEAADVADIGAFFGGLVALVLGLGLLIPAVVFVCLGISRDREVRSLLVAWGALDRDPERDRHLRRPGASLAWLLLSFVLGAAGLALCVIAPASAEPGRHTYGLVALVMGVGMVAWLTALIGAVTALAHRRWVVGVLTGTGTGGGGVAAGVRPPAARKPEPERPPFARAGGPGHR